MKRLVALLIAGVAGLVIAGAVASANASQTTVTLGSTSGTPSGNICGAWPCTYLPFTNASTPQLQVPFDGTVTSFSINSMSAGGKVRLRVLRPAGGGNYTGAGSSSLENLSGTGVDTFPVSMSVKAGDLLGLDNSTSALMFDTTSTLIPIASYFQNATLSDPAIADGQTAMPYANRTGFRLLMSAVVTSNPTTTTTTTTPTVPPSISNPGLTHKRFKVAKQKTSVSAKAKPPKGTSFLFTLSAAAKLQIAITHKVPGRRKGGKCVKPTPKLASAKPCKRRVTVVTLTRANEPKGADSVAFSGRWDHHKLKPGSYKATLTASNAGGVSKAVTLAFKVVK